MPQTGSDPAAHLILGLVAAFGLFGAYAISLVVRFMSARRDAATIREIQPDAFE